MKLLMVVVRDVKLGEFLQPFPVQSKGVAIRSFGEEVNRADAKNVIYQHPEDFSLYSVGEFDTETGVLAGGALPELVVDAIALKVE